MILSGLYSCTKDEPDFREDIIGAYSCIEISRYYDESPGSTGWITETLSTDKIIHVGIISDSSILVSMDGYSFEGRYDEKNKYICTGCENRPADYARFFSKDSITVFRNTGESSSYKYTGNKR